jgi:hypothetical protein
MDAGISRTPHSPPHIKGRMPCPLTLHHTMPCSTLCFLRSSQLSASLLCFGLACFDGLQVQAPEVVSSSEKEDLSRYDYLLHHSPFRALPNLTSPLHSHTPHNSVVHAHGEVSEKGLMGGGKWRDRGRGERGRGERRGHEGGCNWGGGGGDGRGYYRGICPHEDVTYGVC